METGWIGGSRDKRIDVLGRKGGSSSRRNAIRLFLALLWGAFLCLELEEVELLGSSI